MKNSKTYNINTVTNADDIKKFRKSLSLTQAEFADFLGVSRPTVERMESSDKEISGPIALLVDILSENPELTESRFIPDKKYPLRLWYMYKNKKCTLIDVDEMNRKIFVKNYTNKIMYMAFGSNMNPNFEDYEVFLESRCFPKSRDKIKIELDALGLPFYDPLLIIEKTKGKLAEDDFWVDIERTNQ